MSSHPTQPSDHPVPPAPEQDADTPTTATTDIPAEPEGAAEAPAIAPMDPAVCAQQLKERFPGLFGGSVMPIKLRIQADIQTRAPGVFPKAALSAFLRRHTGSTAYLTALVRATHRFDLDGTAGDELSDEHRQAAMDELARRRQMQDERRAQEASERRARAGLLQEFEANSLPLADFCAQRSITEPQLEALLVMARLEAKEPPRGDRRGRPGGDRKAGAGEGRNGAGNRGRRGDGRAVRPPAAASGTETTAVAVTEPATAGTPAAAPDARPARPARPEPRPDAPRAVAHPGRGAGERRDAGTGNRPPRDDRGPRRDGPAGRNDLGGRTDGRQGAGNRRPDDRRRAPEGFAPARNATPAAPPVATALAAAFSAALSQASSRKDTAAQAEATPAPAAPPKP